MLIVVPSDRTQIELAEELLYKYGFNASLLPDTLSILLRKPDVRRVVSVVGLLLEKKLDPFIVGRVAEARSESESEPLTIKPDYGEIHLVGSRDFSEGFEESCLSFFDRSLKHGRNVEIAGETFYVSGRGNAVNPLIERDYFLRPYQTAFERLPFASKPSVIRLTLATRLN